MSDVVLVVSPHFPPSTLAGVHRARHLAKHLPAHGWRPIVIRVDERHYEERPDPALAALVPTSVEQARAGAIPARLARMAGVGDIGLRALLPIMTTITSTAARARPGAILITGSPYYPMLLSRWARRRLGLPVVLDFQDPWVSAEGATRPAWSKGGVAHRLALALEPRALRDADFVTSVSTRQNEDMAARYPWLDRARMAAIPIGGDPEDFDAMRAHPRAAALLDPRMINLSYVGAFLPRAGPLARVLFRALRGLRQSQPELAAMLRLHFVGTSNQPDGDGTYRVRPIAREEGVADLVVETPPRAPYLEALRVLAQSHGLILIGSDEPHYTASKIYPALMSGRPYVSLYHRASSSHAILQAAGGGRTFSFAGADELRALAGPLQHALARLASNPETFGRCDPAAYAPYTADSVSRGFASVLDAARSKSGAH